MIDPLDWQARIDGTLNHSRSCVRLPLRSCHAITITLFDNAAASGLLAAFGYDADRLAEERAKIEAFDTANQAQEMAKGASQQASQDQEAALTKMNEWVAQYVKIAKVALRGKKQSLEKIGVTARTSKTAAQRAAPTKAAATRAAKKA